MVFLIDVYYEMVKSSHVICELFHGAFFFCSDVEGKLEKMRKEVLEKATPRLLKEDEPHSPVLWKQIYFLVY